MLARVFSLFVGSLSTASVSIMLLVATAALRRRRARLFVLVLAVVLFVIAVRFVRGLTGRGTSAIARLIRR
jgi:hypothetical protein